MSTATEQAQDWLQTFEAALARADVEAATALFADECYWRAVVAFTWNLKTLEGRTAIRAMLEACAASARTTNWQVEGEATEADGVVDAWITFETAAGCGKGRLRLRDG